VKHLIDIDPQRVRALVAGHEIDVRSASIREMNKLVNGIEQEIGTRFVRMEFGIPGLPVPQVALAAERDALDNRELAHVYAPFEGVPALKEEAAKFVKLFMDLDVSPTACVPTVGAMEGCFAGLAVAGRMSAKRRKVLFLSPGFPVNRLQARFLGVDVETIDFYDHRGDKLVKAVEDLAKRDEICGILWSSPNNPSWIVLKESELEGLGRVCDEYDLTAIEDLAYFGMDVRQDYYRPGEPPYQPTILRYTRNGICVISSSKIFSYAGQRIGFTVISPQLMERKVPELKERFGTSDFGHALIHGALYPIAACVPESPQYGLLALLQAANEGDSDVFQPAAEYARRAAIMKPLFLDNGFRLVYDNDLGEPLADGFYFTVAHPAFENGADLLPELLCYGISAITLETTGGCRPEGIRACVSLVGDDQFGILEDRLRAFNEEHA
jgi:aspartate/methionine/tyrosine aminotransferase